MIGTIFEFGNEMIEVRVNKNDILFRSSGYGNKFYPIEAIQLSKAGLIKEFPDLKDDPEWRTKGIERFKNFLNSLPNEVEKIKYIIKDLSKYGYIPRYKQREGFRVEKL